MRVPEYNRQVGPGELPGVRQNIQTDASNFLGGTEQVFLKQSAAAVQDMGRAAMTLLLREEQEANRTRVQDALNQFETRRQDRLFGQNGALNVRGADVFTQQNSIPLTDNVVTDLDHAFGEIADTLGNDEQKRLFAQHAQTAIAHTRGQLLQHEAEQYRVYQRGVGLATIDTSQKTIGLNYNNPELVRQSLDAIHTASVDLGKLEGFGEEYGASQAQKHKSDALNGAIQSALAQNDHASATKILHDFAPDMDTNDMLKAYQTITKEQDARASFGMAQNVMSAIYPRMQTSDGDRALNILFKAESGGNHFVPGTQTPVTSPKGAVGIAQVMPATGPEAAKLAGLAWDENRFKIDPEYNKALGAAYFNQQLKTFRGDLGMAYAAYNAGPGATKEAIDQASKEGGNWLSYLPKETQAYVTNNMNAYAAGEGQYQRPTLADAHATALEHIGPNASPDLRKQVLAEVTNQYEEQTKAIKQREEESTAEAMRQLLQNGGKYSALPVQVRAAIPPKEVDNLMNFGQKIAKGEDTSSLWLYNKLTNHPEELSKLSDDEFYGLRADLSESDFKHFANERQKAKGNTASNGPGELNSTAIKTELDNRLRMLGTDPSPSDTLQKDLANRVGGIRQFVNNYFMAAQMEAGKKFTDTEVAQHLDALFAKNYAFKGFWSNSSGTLLNMKASDLPGEIQTGIKAAFKRQGINDPTDAQILNAYWSTQTTVKK
ncbi:transglycosylase SLT domain-containing protein [Methylomonas montana]|uniref:transglycosylase SLT domain-containing protein n=1 Tax=Methylomonas montana TaxID=3058963 RepID=UPI002657F144|nr:transglycosylase SLT domain-containing protein [Methylomonas montana]WKJ88751.1 transglycosylase SLT domain-containing protein [Methylomonas montana]